MSWYRSMKYVMINAQGGNMMNQQKTGAYLKDLRKSKGLTQEQLAEQFNVSSRTVSRWETGSNMPDIAILIDLADFYDVDIREILNGERENENMDNETKDTLKKVAEYATQKTKIRKMKLFAIVLVFMMLAITCDLLFAGESCGILYGVVDANICDLIMTISISLQLIALVTYIVYCFCVSDIVKK